MRQNPIRSLSRSFAFAALLTAPCASLASQTTASGFSAAENRANWNALGEIEDLGAGMTPGVAVTPDETTHVVYMAEGKIFHRQREPRGRFGSPEAVALPSDVAAAEAVFNSPHLVSDRAGTLHLVFTSGFTKASQKTWYTNRQGGTWKIPFLAIDQTATGRRANYPRLATDGTAAFVGAFAGGGSTLVKLVDLVATPRIAAKAETLLWVAHPLLGANGEVAVVGRRGAAGHHLERYSADLVASGTRELLSRGTPTKTFEATAAVIDDAGVIHAAGAAGSPHSTLWYTTSTRAAAGQDVILGPELGTGIKEYTFPTMIRDDCGKIYISYRRHPIGDGQLAVFDERAGRFETPITFAPAIHQRLRWNAPLAAAPGGGVYTVWESEGRVFIRAVGQTPDAKAAPRE